MDGEDATNAITCNVFQGSGYQNQKWGTERKVADTFEGYDFPIIRYAEVLLNYAEAMYELGTTGKALDDALNISLNLVRLFSVYAIKESHLIKEFGMRFWYVCSTLNSFYRLIVNKAIVFV